jgi:hypothetical protein
MVKQGQQATPTSLQAPHSVRILELTPLSDFQTSTTLATIVTRTIQLA